MTTGPSTPAKRTFSLQRLLVFVGLIAVSCWLIRLASVDALFWATFPALCCIALAFGTLTGRNMLAFVITFAIAIASYVTTGFNWDGGFPFAAIKISFVDEQGKPIPDVAMSVTRHWNGQPALGYPISEYQGTSLISNREGTIVCSQIRSGLQFGGHSWWLFWCIRVGATSPKFDVHFEHPNFAPTMLPIWQLFETDDLYGAHFPTTITQIDGQSVELPVYEHTIVLFSR